MSQFAGSVACSVDDLSIENQSGPEASSECQENQILQIRFVASNSEMKLGERSGITIMFDTHWESRKYALKLLFEIYVVPSRKVGRIEKYAFLNAQGTTNRHAHGANLPAS